MEDSSVFSSSSPSPSHSSSSPSAPSEQRDDSNNMNVLSSFLNGSKEIGNYSANFTDLLKHPYTETPAEGQPTRQDDDDDAPEESTGPTEEPSTNKRKAPEEPSFEIGEDKELSTDDKKAIKKQRRLAKNREAAQLFRQRQKEYISNLETRANQLIAANTEANARAELIASENKLMREQLAYLRNFMKQAVSFSYPYNNGANAPVPTSPVSMVAPPNPFLMPPGMPVGVDSMGNFIDSSNAPAHNAAAAAMGLASSIPLADGTSISFNLMPSTSPSFLSFMPIQGSNSLYAGSSVPSSPHAFSAHMMHDAHHSAGIMAVKDEKALSPD